MGRKLNKLEIIIVRIKEIFSIENIINYLLKLSKNENYWKTEYDKLLEDYCTVIYEVTDGILSYKHYNPKDILMLDDERINRIVYRNVLEELLELKRRFSIHNKSEHLKILDKFIENAQENHDSYKRG